jgi:myo-inositol-1-phosphate synthase
VAIDLIRCAKLARDRGAAGPIEPVAACFCKHPPRQTTDDLAFSELEQFLADVS